MSPQFYHICIYCLLYSEFLRTRNGFQKCKIFKILQKLNEYRSLIYTSLLGRFSATTLNNSFTFHELFKKFNTCSKKQKRYWCFDRAQTKRVREEKGAIFTQTKTNHKSHTCVQTDRSTANAAWKNQPLVGVTSIGAAFSSLFLSTPLVLAFSSPSSLSSSRSGSSTVSVEISTLVLQ